MLIFLKLGGSLITDKRQPETPRLDVIRRLAQEVAQARAANPALKLVIGNGAGSFGHLHAKRHGTRQGVHTPAQWMGFAATADAAARLTRLVATALLEAGVPAWSIQPSATLRCVDGALAAGPDWAVAQALQRDLAPLIHGDVALDDVRGGTIAGTEEIMEWLARRLPMLMPDAQPLARVVLAGEVDGIYSADPLQHADARLIPQITPRSFGQVASGLGGSHGVDVTGGMAAKVAQALRMIENQPGLEVVVCSGLIPGNIVKACSQSVAPGTCILGNGT
ncbi:MAG: isopentenyl phosphate kinase [Caldilineaceae bacterium]